MAQECNILLHKPVHKPLLSSAILKRAGGPHCSPPRRHWPSCCCRGTACGVAAPQRHAERRSGPPAGAPRRRAHGGGARHQQPYHDKRHSPCQQDRGPRDEDMNSEVVDSWISGRDLQTQAPGPLITGINYDKRGQRAASWGGGAVCSFLVEHGLTRHARTLRSPQLIAIGIHAIYIEQIPPAPRTWVAQLLLPSSGCSCSAGLRLRPRLSLGCSSPCGCASAATDH